MRSFLVCNRTVRGCVGAVAAVTMLSGCFAYVPVPRETLQPGDRVQIQLNETQAVRAGSVTANDVIEVTGELISSDSAAVNLSAYYLRSPSGFEQVAVGETARIPALNIAAVRENRLSPLRTMVVAALAVTAGAVFVTQVADLRGGGNPGNPIGGGQN